MKIDLENKEFKKAFDLVSNTNQSFFLTGKAGTGKSTFLKYIVENVDKNIVVVAPTGIAAINANGATIHSFFRFPLRPLIREDKEIKIFNIGNEKRNIISSMETLIIDEISMVRADLLDGIDYSLRKNGGDPKKPFGGKQLVFVGDIFQLEPVVTREEKDVLSEFYNSTYFFDSKVLKNKMLTTIELQKTYRQKDKYFINLLDKIRLGQYSQTDLKKINSRVILNSTLKDHDFTITLTTTKDLARIENNSRLRRISKPSYTYLAEINDEFEESKYPTEQELTLKEGAQVIFLRNDPNGRWVNGTLAKIYELSEDDIIVKLKNGNIHDVETVVWENIKYKYNNKENRIEQEIAGTFEQYPLKLAWAITIHKIQGMTFHEVVIDFGTGTFAGGQAYVALSRVTSFEGLFLKQKIYLSDIFVDKKIKDFANKHCDYSHPYKIEPNSYEGRFDRENTIYDFNNYKAANGNFKKAIKIKPKDDKYYFNRGYSKYQLANYDDAISDFTKALKINPSNVLALINKGKVQVLMHKREEEEIANSIETPWGYPSNQYSSFPKQSLNDFTNAIKINSANFDAYYLRGCTKFYLRLEKMAIGDFTKAIEIEPNNARAYYFRGLSKGNSKKIKAAISDFSKAIIIDPSFSSAYFSRGYGLILQGHYKEAIVDFNKSIAINPDKIECYYYRGIAKLCIRDSMMEDLGMMNNNAEHDGFILCQEALDDFTKVLNEIPTWRDASQLRGIAESGLGDDYIYIGCIDYMQFDNFYSEEVF